MPVVITRVTTKGLEIDYALYKLVDKESSMQKKKKINPKQDKKGKKNKHRRYKINRIPTLSDTIYKCIYNKYVD